MTRRRARPGTARRAIAFAFAFGFACAGTLAACGVPVDDGARPIDAEQIPEGLTADEPPTTTTTSQPITPSQAEQIVVLYFVRRSALEPSIDLLDGRVSVATVVDALLDGPAPVLAADGFRSALAGPDVVGRVTLVRGVARVELLPAIETLAPSEQLLAVGQLVMTLTARPGVGQVRFTLGDAPVEIPTADGRLVAASVTRDDYAELVAPAEPG